METGDAREPLLILPLLPAVPTQAVVATLLWLQVLLWPQIIGSGSSTVVLSCPGLMLVTIATR